MYIKTGLAKKVLKEKDYKIRVSKQAAVEFSKLINNYASDLADKVIENTKFRGKKTVEAADVIYAIKTKTIGEGA